MSYAYNVKRGKAASRARASENKKTARLLGPLAVHMHSHARRRLAALISSRQAEKKSLEAK